MRNKSGIIILGGILVVSIVVMLVFIFKDSLLNKKAPYSTTSQTTSAGNVQPDQTKIIAKVGDENIYQADLTIEETHYPAEQGVDRAKVLLEKIVADSKTLQAANADGLIQLDASVYNSGQKDYLKRTKLVEQVKNIIDAKSETITGSIISIWFFNSDPPAVGYDAGRKIAQGKINALYADVKSKKMTMKQAGDQIMNDSSLQQVDVAYKSNAIYNFSANPEDKISLDPVFDAKLRSLKEGELTDIYVAQDIDHRTGKRLDAVFMFGQVTQRKNIGTNLDFAKWYAQKESAYEVTYY